MSATFEIRVAAALVDRALTALAPNAWALELYGDNLVLALFESAELERVRALVPFATEVRALGAKTPAEWVEWRQPLQAIQVGPLWITTERSAPCLFGQYRLRLLTKDAFGSGLHETTLLCLQRILELSPIDTILDVGTGSGILALAALSLGAKHASATELDPAARETAQKNAERNGLAARFRLEREIPREEFPVVVANIIAPVLLELAPSIAAAVAPNGTLLLSGLRDHDVDPVATRYRDAGLIRGPTATRGTWNRLELRRP
jgi:ribosomal protein L11 methyltransferase